MPSPSLAGRADALARHAAVLLGFSIPISVALDNILLAVVLLFWLASGGFREKAATIAANKVVLAAVALFAILAAGLAWGKRLPGDGTDYLVKYIDLAFIPVFATIFRDARARALALKFFCAAMILAFVVAALNTTALLPENPWIRNYPDYPRGFKYSITHGLLSAFAALAFALLAREAPRGPRRLLWIAAAIVAAHSVLLVAISRTAYVSLVVLGVYFVLASIRRQWVPAVLLTLVVLLAGAYVASPSIQARTARAVAETLDWEPGRSTATSVGSRLESYRTSLPLIREHPVLGGGTGSFPLAYAEAVKGTDARPITNPHNEYILLAVQIGLVGVALLLHLFWRQWRLAQALPSRLEADLARGLVLLIAIGCLSNSLLLDHTEGLFFAWFTGLLYGGLQSSRHG